MDNISKRKQTILQIFLKGEELSSSVVFGELEKIGDKVSQVTVKRALSEMTEAHLLHVSGAGPGTTYTITVTGRACADVRAEEYCKIEPDKRFGMSRFNFELFSQFPSDIFSSREQETLTSATKEYEKRILHVTPTAQKKELERLVIELSWKSSRIEGNTYTLLDTEKLILEHKEAVGHSKSEAVMILNHKHAFTFVHEHAKKFKTLTRANLEQVHSLLVKDLNVGVGIRRSLVGVLGSKYQPLDNVHQITDALLALSRTINALNDPYAKALVGLIGVSYIQPFEDGNKRTSRLIANALLMAHGLAPLSYRSVDENAYREAMLVFYELNSIVPFKKIFIEQYDFAARNYAVK